MSIRPMGPSASALAGTFAPKRKLTSATTFRHQARGARFYAGYDPVDNVSWWKTTGLSISTDGGANVTGQPLPAGVPDATKLSGIVRWKGYIYIQAQLVANGPVHIFRTLPPSAGALSWTDVLTTAGNAFIITLAGSEWGSSDYLYMAEYGTPSGGPTVYRSTDGVTWETVLGPITGLNHIHCVAPDPYNPGHVWMTAGDGQGKNVARSTDYGATWTWVVTDNAYQAVQISFTSDYVWFGGDAKDIPVYVIDRAAPTVPIIASAGHHSHQAVPGGLGARGPFTDGQTTGATTAFKSASAAFNNDDVGRFIRLTATGGPLSEDGDLYIMSVTDGQTVVLNKAAGGATTGIGFYLEGDRFIRGAFYGNVDPATGIYYFVSNDITSGGNRYGLFALLAPFTQPVLLQVLSQAGTGNVAINNGKVWFHQVSHPLLSLAA